MIRVLLDALPEPLPREAIGHNIGMVDGVDKPAVYFNNDDIDLAASLGGEMLVTE